MVDVLLPFTFYVKRLKNFFGTTCTFNSLDIILTKTYGLGDPLLEMLSHLNQTLACEPLHGWDRRGGDSEDTTSRLPRHSRNSQLAASCSSHNGLEY